MQDVVFWVVTP